MLPFDCFAWRPCDVASRAASWGTRPVILSPRGHPWRIFPRCRGQFHRQAIKKLKSSKPSGNAQRKSAVGSAPPGAAGAGGPAAAAAAVNPDSNKRRKVEPNGERLGSAGGGQDRGSAAKPVQQAAATLDSRAGMGAQAVDVDVEMGVGVAEDGGQEGAAAPALSADKDKRCLSCLKEPKAPFQGPCNHICCFACWPQKHGASQGCQCPVPTCRQPFRPKQLRKVYFF